MIKIHAFLFLLYGLLVCCTVDTSTVTDPDEAIPDEDEMQMFDLNTHELAALPLNIYIPPGEGDPQIDEGPLGGTLVTSGKNFQIEIIPGGVDIAAKKEELNEDDIFKTTYLVNDSDAIVFRKELEDAGVTQYHFYAVRRIGNNSYSISNVGSGFSEDQIRKMLAAAQTISGQQAAVN